MSSAILPPLKIKIKYSHCHRFQTHHENIIPLLLLGIIGTIGLALVFVCCELGQRMSDAFDGINFTIEQLDWYLIPVEVQQMLPMIITITQQPVELKCFGNIVCGREVLKNVSI